jgi:hypothetical protein
MTPYTWHRSTFNLSFLPHRFPNEFIIQIRRIICIKPQNIPISNSGDANHTPRIPRLLYRTRMSDKNRLRDIATVWQASTTVMPAFMCWITWRAVLSREALARDFMGALEHPYNYVLGGVQACTNCRRFGRRYL